MKLISPSDETELIESKTRGKRIPHVSNYETEHREVNDTEVSKFEFRVREKAQTLEKALIEYLDAASSVGGRSYGGSKVARN